MLGDWTHGEVLGVLEVRGAGVANGFCFGILSVQVELVATVDTLRGGGGTCDVGERGVNMGGGGV